MRDAVLLLHLWLMDVIGGCRPDAKGLFEIHRVLYDIELKPGHQNVIHVGILFCKRRTTGVPVRALRMASTLRHRSSSSSGDRPAVVQLSLRICLSIGTMFHN